MAKKSRKPMKKAVAKRPAVKKAAAKALARKSGAKTATARKPAAKETVAKTPSKPRGSALVSVAPSFTANDAEASIKWYCDVLGFKVVERWDHEGQFMGAQIGSGSVLININQDDWKQGRDRVKGQGTRMFITMGPDVDGYASAVKARGGVLAHEPISEWGMRAFAVNDPDGYKLTFMSALPK